MKTYDELQHHPIYRAWIDAPQMVIPPNGENFEHFRDRIIMAFKRIITTEQSYTFVIHGGVIRLLLAHFGLENKSFQQVLANHRTIYTLTWNTLADFQGGARCTLYSEALITVNEPM